MKTLLCTAALVLAALPAGATTMGAPVGTGSGSGSSSSSGGTAAGSGTTGGSATGGSSTTGGSSSGTMSGSMGSGFSAEQLRQALTQSGLRNITILSGGQAGSAASAGGSGASSSSSSSSAGAVSLSGGDVYVVRAEVPNGGAVLITIVPQSAMMAGAPTTR